MVLETFVRNLGKKEKIITNIQLSCFQLEDVWKIIWEIRNYVFIKNNLKDIDQLEIDYNKCTRNIKSIDYKKNWKRIEQLC
jgi:hypothetical protein